MATLNARYREIECPTDVLSFSLVEGDHAERRGVLLGDVVVSLETAERQARRARRTLDDEVLGLLIHGTLHLLGYDHEAEADARRMRAAERRVLRLVRG
jgi:rRNA maturation RNase YbeY